MMGTSQQRGQTIGDGARADRDLELVERLGKLHVAVISDCLDAVGVRDNTMHRRIRPLDPSARLAGYAATVQLDRVDAVPADPTDYYKGEIAALEGLTTGDIMVVSTCEGSYWGELLATACRARGAHGLVADCWTRDTRALLRMGFPTFVAGIDPTDSLGRTDVTAWNVPISCGGVDVAPEDLVIADNDGVAVIPAALGEEVVGRAEEKVGAEADMRADLAAGMPLGEAFRTYGIL
jgi:4-hydroxy-4-methyl-2-oxoglutarate aldolase